MRVEVLGETEEERMLGWALESVKKSMRWNEQRFGREYDLSVFSAVAIKDFHTGAIENKGLVTFSFSLFIAGSNISADKTPSGGNERAPRAPYYRPCQGSPLPGRMIRTDI